MIIERVIRLPKWCEIKILLSDKSSNILFKEGEIWWCMLGMNVGREIYGKGDKFKRPILVLKKLDSQSLFAIPLTSRDKEGSWYVPIIHDEKKRVAILSQARMLDSRRLVNRIGTLNGDEFQRIKDAFILFYSA